jgi:STAS-like domain of unknown function (DUF4325)
MDIIEIYVKDFSITPGSRYIDEGKKAHSGQEFRENILDPKFKEILNTNNQIIVNLDGTIGYGTSWLEEVFGGLARIYGHKIVLEKLKFISEEEDYLIDDIIQYIKDAEKL